MLYVVQNLVHYPMWAPDMQNVSPGMVFFFASNPDEANLKEYFIQQ